MQSRLKSRNQALARQQVRAVRNVRHQHKQVRLQREQALQYV